MLFHSVNQVDHVYGPYYDGSVLKIGDKALKLNEKIKIGNHTYQGTRGFYELTEEDMENYYEIFRYTDSHLNVRGQPKSNRSTKYKKIIAPMFNKRGNGPKFSDMSVKDKT